MNTKSDKGKSVGKLRVRELSGLSQENFAKKYGIPVSTVRKQEQGVMCA